MIRALPSALVALGALAASPVLADDPHHTLTGALIVNPEGLFLRYDAGWDVGDDGFGLALYNEWLVFANGLGVQLSYKTDPAWLEFHVDAGAEPGFFLKLGPDQGKGDVTTRTYGLRWLVRPQMNLNIRTSDWWLYSRTTGVYRHRGFRQEEIFRDLILDEEWSIEQASALMYRFAGALPGQGVSWWGYGEHTVGRIRGQGVIPNRVSGGVILEGWPTSSALLNLDVFYSYARVPLDGWGGIVSWYIRWGSEAPAP
ncbi:MAG: hypothetical protein ACE366_23895 [Bradymonadia bacterium]